eukprot:6790248-Prymnesium_polylepis.1
MRNQLDSSPTFTSGRQRCSTRQLHPQLQCCYWSERTRNRGEQGQLSIRAVTPANHHRVSGRRKPGGAN